MLFSWLILVRLAKSMSTMLSLQLFSTKDSFILLSYFLSTSWIMSPPATHITVYVVLKGSCVSLNFQLTCILTSLKYVPQATSLSWVLDKYIYHLFIPLCHSEMHIYIYIWIFKLFSLNFIDLPTSLLPLLNQKTGYTYPYILSTLCCVERRIKY